jgi:hypothetical protein
VLAPHDELDRQLLGMLDLLVLPLPLDVIDNLLHLVIVARHHKARQILAAIGGGKTQSSGSGRFVFDLAFFN